MLIKPFINKILFTLEVENETRLLILLSKVGNITRKGDGSPLGISLPLMQGISHDGHFEAMMMTVDESIFQYAGVMKQPERQGKECRLTIVFQGANEVDFSFRVVYGEDSQGPPLELTQLLINAVKITSPWYNQQLQPEEPQSKWWQFWK